MPRTAAEILFQGAVTPIAAYDSTKLNFGTLVRQYNLGANPEDKFVGPVPNMVARPLEQSTPFAVAFQSAIQFTPDLIQWYYAENSAAGVTRRIMLYETNLVTATPTWRGFITVTFPAATNHTIRGFEMSRDLYSTGTVSVTGTAVTGTTTAWLTNRFAVGARIGFGSTDPTLIATWYNISAMATDTGITIDATAPTLTGVAYVIEELRAIITTTNATTTNGGLFIVKGINRDTFTPAGTIIAAATTVDNIRACYWIKDAAVVTNIGAAGGAFSVKVSNTDHTVYVLDTANRVFLYNLRAALTLTAGATSALDGAGGGFKFSTGVQAITGTMQQNNNGIIATLSHGPGSGIPSFYWVTNNRINRSSLTALTSASTTWQSDTMTEVPPGGVNTYAASATITGIDYAPTIDRLAIMTNGANRSYITQYNTIGSQMDIVWLSDQKTILQGTAALTTLPVQPNTLSQLPTAWVEGGLACVVTAGTAANTNLIFWVAIGAHWTYAASTQQRIIAPKISTVGASKLYRVSVIRDNLFGSADLGSPGEPIRTYARTGGIDDNLGAWVLLNKAGDLSGLAATGLVQFMFEFKVLGLLLLPARLLGLMMTFETSDMPPELSAYANDNDVNNSIVGFIQNALFASVVPNLNISFYKQSDNTLVQTQDSTASANGVFEFWNGSAWAAGTGTNTLNLRRRYRPTVALPSAEILYFILKTI